MENKDTSYDTLKNTVGKVGDFISDIADTLLPVASLFAPHLTTPVVTVSQVAKKIGELDDDVLENNVMGLSATVDLLERELNHNQESNKTIDPKAIELVVDNLNAINDLLQKTTKIIK